MKLLPSLAFSLLVLATIPPLASAQADGTLPTQQSVYSLYVARHEATARFAELGTARASSKGVRRLAELLAKEHRETGEKITKLAAEGGLALRRPAHDTTDALLASATQLLKDRNGAEFDSTFVVQAHGWLSTLMMDNGRNVLRPLPDGDLKKFAQAYSSFLFRELVEANKLKGEFQKQ